MKKRLVGLVLAAAMTAVTVTGCGGLDNSDVVAEVGETKITAGVANFYARLQQSQYESMYSSFLGDDMWSGEAEEGKTYEDTIKESVMDNLQSLYVLDMHKGDYDIALTEEEEAAIKKAAETFSEDNALEDKELISGDTDTVKELLTLLTVQEKMREAITADVDTEVSDEEAAQKSAQYVYFSFNKTDDSGNSAQMTDEEKEELKKTAEAFQQGAKAAEDFSAYTTEQGYEVSNLTFDAETTSPSAELVQAADALEEGQMTEVVEGASGYYVAKVTSLLDREATDNKKKTIIAEREQAMFNEQVEKWLDEEKVTVHKSVWKKIDFVKQGVAIKETGAEDTQ